MHMKLYTDSIHILNIMINLQKHQNLTSDVAPPNVDEGYQILNNSSMIIKRSKKMSTKLFYLK